MHERPRQRIGERVWVRRTGVALVWLAMLALLVVATAATVDWTIQVATGGS
jgi:hypothetical protein